MGGAGRGSQSGRTYSGRVEDGGRDLLQQVSTTPRTRLAGEAAGLEGTARGNPGFREDETGAEQERTRMSKCKRTNESRATRESTGTPHPGHYRGLVRPYPPHRLGAADQR
ncbi:unnamed protein product [Calypogeia fissa]